MKWAGGAALLTAAALVQVTWASRIEIAGAFPNFVLLAVVAVGMVHGVRSGLASACLGGVLLDLTSSGAVGPHVVALLCGVYAIGFWSRNVERVTAAQAAVGSGAATLLYSLVLVVGHAALREPAASFQATSGLALSAAAYNAVLGPPAIAGIRALAGLGRQAPLPE